MMKGRLISRLIILGNSEESRGSRLLNELAKQACVPNLFENNALSHAPPFG